MRWDVAMDLLRATRTPSASLRVSASTVHCMRTMQPTSSRKAQNSGFMPELAVYKVSQKQEHSPRVHWTGYLANRVTKEVIWHAGPSTVYGTAYVGPDPAAYTDDCLKCDLAAGRRVVAALNGSVDDNGVDGDGGSEHLKAALSVVRKCNKPGCRPPEWMQWLSTKLKEASTPPPVARRPSGPRPASIKPKSCRKCYVPGCSRKPCTGWNILRDKLSDLTQRELSRVLEICKETKGNSVSFLP